MIVKIEEMHLDCGPVAEAAKGDVFSIKVPAKVRLSDRLYVWDVME